MMVDGHRIRYLEAGSGRPIILLHGLGGYAEKWIPAMKHLSGICRVVVPDMIGSGLSDKPVADYTPLMYTAFLKGFIESLNIRNPCISGASLGGQVAVEFAVAYPEIPSRLVLIAPAGIMKHSTPALDAYITAALYPRQDSVGHALALMETSGRDASPKLVASFIENMKRPNAKMAFMSSLLCFKNSRNIINILPNIRCPTLLVWGYEDPIIPVSYSSKFLTSIPSCTFVGIENCGHTPYVQYPELIASQISQFMSPDGVIPA